MSLSLMMAAQRGMEKYILSGALPNITNVTWGLPNAQPYTDGTRIHLPAPDMKADAVTAMLWRYKCEHELCHESKENSDPHWRTVMKQHKKLWTPLNKVLANMLSDFVTERNRIGHLAGRDKDLLIGREAFLRQQFEALGKSATTPLGAMFVLDNQLRTVWNEYITPKKASAELSALAELIHSAGDWADLRNEKDVWELAFAIEKLLRREVEGIEDNPALDGSGGDGDDEGDGGGDGDDEGDGGGGDDDEGDDGDGDGDDEGSDGDGDGDDEGDDGDGDGDDEGSDGDGDGDDEGSDGKPAKESSLDKAAEKIMRQIEGHIGRPKPKARTAEYTYARYSKPSAPMHVSKPVDARKFFKGL